MNLLTPQHSTTTGVLLAGILTSLYSSRSVSHKQDNPHDHGNCNCDRVVRERVRYLIHKMWRVGHVLRIVQNTGSSTKWDGGKHGAGEGTGESTGGHPIYDHGCFFIPVARLSKACQCGNRGGI